MGLFKKKKIEKTLPLPPAPAEGPSFPSGFGDVEEMHPGKKELPVLPPLPKFPPFRVDVEEAENKEFFPKPFVPETSVSALNEFEVPAPVPREKEVKPIPKKLASKAFIAVDDYKEIIGSSSVIREKLMAAENHLKKLEDLKAEEERLLDKWRSYLEQVEKKMSFVDQVVAKARGESNE